MIVIFNVSPATAPVGSAIEISTSPCASVAFSTPSLFVSSVIVTIGAAIATGLPFSSTGKSPATVSTVTVVVPVVVTVFPASSELTTETSTVPSAIKSSVATSTE